MCRWFMYRWKLTSFVVFSSLFWTVSMASASLTWFLLTWVLKSETPKNEIKEEEELPEAIKEELGRIAHPANPSKRSRRKNRRPACFKAILSRASMQVSALDGKVQKHEGYRNEGVIRPRVFNL